jgi:hypothetical protein
MMSEILINSLYLFFSAIREESPCSTFKDIILPDKVIDRGMLLSDRYRSRCTARTTVHCQIVYEMNALVLPRLTTSITYCKYKCI